MSHNQSQHQLHGQSQNQDHDHDHDHDSDQCQDHAAFPELSVATKRVLNALEQAGDSAWLVGGWVRDVMLGRLGEDVDMACSAPWQLSKQRLEAAGCAVFETGVAHGTITAVLAAEHFEITTFRTEGSYSDCRHPDQVQFVQSIEEDLARRDFTVNALAYHPTRGMLDCFGGFEDLKQGLIRAVGDPEKRFSEDALRIVRAMRFSCQLGFTVEPTTLKAMNKTSELLAQVAKERLAKELRLLMQTSQSAYALRTFWEPLVVLIPALKALRGFDQQSPYHSYDVLEHTMRVMEGVEAFTGAAASEALRWAALFHDIAKPVSFSEDCNNRGHFFGHPELGAEMTTKIMGDFGLPKKLIQHVRTLVLLHDTSIKLTHASALRLLVKLQRVAPCVKGSPSQAYSWMFELICLRQADALAKAVTCRSYARSLEAFAGIVRQIKHEQWPLCIQELAISGEDLQAIDPTIQGLEMGLLLTLLFELVLEGSCENTKDSLLSEAARQRGIDL